MTTSRRALSSLAAIALSAGLLTACGDEGDSDPSAGSEATVTAPADASDNGGATAEPTRPDVPKPDPKDYPEMDEHTDAGAEQAYKYFWAVTYWTYATGDTGEYRKLHSSSCDSCTDNLEKMQDLNEMGEFWSATEVEDVKTEVFDSEYSDLEVGYVYSAGEHTEPVRGNTKRRTVEAGEYVSVGGLNWDDTRWVVGAMSVKKNDGSES